MPYPQCHGHHLEAFSKRSVLFCGDSIRAHTFEGNHTYPSFLELSKCTFLPLMDRFSQLKD